jgi:hypothetical protein
MARLVTTSLEMPKSAIFFNAHPIKNIKLNAQNYDNQNNAVGLIAGHQNVCRLQVAMHQSHSVHFTKSPYQMCTMKLD